MTALPTPLSAALADVRRARRTLNVLELFCAVDRLLAVVARLEA